ncbi:unnamed protein product [Hydatigera taeniaeformis]|uniref:Heterogeneous nuclear ribonucleoproteins A2/B1 n=1 Tax=Hydatigena taeniaeformis TaxID=6205 RepID=A0A0R3WHU5_HYDTA|nr:unnamed protein product [Hydatigera taeniaeformis]
MYNRYSENNDSRTEQYRKLFIGGLTHNTTEDHLKEYYSAWGEIVDVVVMKDSQSGRSRGFGFVTYKEPEMVDTAQANRPHEIDGKIVEAKRAMPREDSSCAEAHMTVKKLYVGGLKRDVTTEDLREYFSKYGKIVDCEVVTSKDTNISRGFGFVTFDDYDPVDKAILYKPHTIKSSQSDVRKALSREEMNTIRRKTDYRQDYGYGGGYRNGGYGPPGNYSGYLHHGYAGPPPGPMGGYHDNWDPYPPNGCWNNGMGDGFGHYGGQSYGGGPMRGPPGGGYQLVVSEGALISMSLNRRECIATYTDPLYSFRIHLPFIQLVLSPIVLLH